MMKAVVTTDQVPVAIGPYSQAVKFGNFLFTSGQLPVDGATCEIASGGIEGQTKRALANLQILLAEAGASLDTVVKTTVYLQDMDNFTVFNRIYSEFFTIQPPARSCVEVSRLPKDVMVEIEAIAAIINEATA